MLEHLVTNLFETVAIIIFGVGFTTMLLNRNFIKKIIGFNFMDTGIYLFLAAKGYIDGRAAPIIANSITDAELYINPVPSGLVLTGIVVSVSVTAFLLALAVKLYENYNTLDMDEIFVLMRQEKEEH